MSKRGVYSAAFKVACLLTLVLVLWGALVFWK